MSDTPDNRADGQARRGRFGWAGWIVAALTVGLVVLLWAWGASRPGFAGRVLRNAVFVKFGLIALGSAVALGGLLVLLAGRGRPGRLARRAGLAGDSDGTAMVEFALVLPVAMGVVLIMIQAMFMMSAAVVVNYAAYSAARTAIVWIPKDVTPEPPEPRRDINGVQPAQYNEELPNELSAQEADKSLKFRKIYQAAWVSCVPIAGRAASVDSDDTALAGPVEHYFRQQNASPPGWVRRLMPAQFTYAREHTQVQLAPPANSPSQYDPNESITVTVKHDFCLSMPFAGALFAEKRTSDGYASAVTATCTFTNEGVSNKIEEDRFTPLP